MYVRQRMHRCHESGISELFSDNHAQVDATVILILLVQSHMSVNVSLLYTDGQCEFYC